MQFSIWNFKDWFERTGIAQSYMIPDGSVLISRLSSDSSAEDADACALVQSGSSQTDCSGFHSVLRVGNDRILFPVAAPYEIYNEGCAMIECLTEWENGLLDAIAAGSTPQQLLDCAQTQLPFPLALLRRDGAIFCHSSDWQLTLNKEKTQHLRQILLQRQRMRLSSFHTLILDVPRTILTAPLLSGQEPIGFLFAYEGSIRFRPGDLYIFQTLADIMQTALCSRTKQPVSMHPAADWFAQSVETPEGEIPLPPPAVNDWEAEDQYAVLMLPTEQHSSSDLKALAARLTDNDHCCIITADGFASLLHAKTLPALHVCLEQMRTLLPASCPLGSSLSFQDFSLLPYFYRQAVWAAHCAQQRQLPAYHFSDSLSDRLLHACHSLSGVQSLVHPDILRIVGLDPTGEEELLHILYAYLISGCSIVRASDALFIHRNTLRGKLKKIECVCSGNWDDEPYREQMLLSLLLYQAPNSKSDT